MSADMIPVNMRRNRSNSLICQLFNLRRNIADAKPRVDQQRTVISFKEIAVRFFPMTVFADYMCAGINCINRKPRFHCHSLFPAYMREPKCKENYTIHPPN